MNDQQIDMLRDLIKQEVDAAQIDGMDHGSWGWAEKRLEECWKQFQESFNPVEIDGIKDENAELGGTEND